MSAAIFAAAMLALIAWIVWPHIRKIIDKLKDKP